MLGLCLGLALTGTWFLRPDGTAFSADFLVFWVTSGLILDAEPLAPYDQARLTALCRALIGPDSDALIAWLYPPHGLFVVAPLGLLPLLPAWIAWVAATLGAFALSLRAVLGRLGVALALGLPASLGCLMVGQNGFLTAALLAGTLHLLDRRPWVAGLLLGLLTYKPHFGPLFPLVLLATGRWRTATGAAATALALAGAAELAFGPGAWAAFLHATQAQTLAMVGAGAWDWRKMQSAFGMTQALGGPRWLALLVQAGLALAVAWLVLRVWRRPATAAVRGAALVAGALLLPPYVFIYDAPVATVAMAFLLRDALDHGFLRGEKAALVLVALAPLAQLLTMAMTLPAAASILLWLAVRRAEASAVGAGASGVGIIPDRIDHDLRPNGHRR
jgi:hypothetical protein